MAGMHSEDAKKEDKGNKNIEFYRVYITYPSSGHILAGKKSWPEQQVLEGSKKLGVVVEDIGHKVFEEVTKGFVLYGIFLSTVGAIALRHFCTAVKTVFVLT